MCFIDLVQIDFGKVGETSRIAERAHKVPIDKCVCKQVASILFVFFSKIMLKHVTLLHKYIHISTVNVTFNFIVLEQKRQFLSFEHFVCKTK